MASTRDIKRRIKSISNTKKITKAMELVSAAKMKKAVNAVLATRAYSNHSWKVAQNIALSMGGSTHPLLNNSNDKNIAILMISSNRGLCGGFNAQLASKVVKFVKNQQSKKGKIDVVTFGKKGRDGMVRYKLNLVADFEKKDITQSISQIHPMIQFLIKEYNDKKYDKIYIAYTDFYSSLVQKPRLMQLLPFDLTEQDEELGGVKGFGEKDEAAKQKAAKLDYLFEPEMKTVLDFLLPRLIEILTYQAVLETEASEHSARMMAMRNASDAAADMISELQLSYNKARQAGITKELAEITSGAMALQKKKK